MMIRAQRTIRVLALWLSVAAVAHASESPRQRCDALNGTTISASLISLPTSGATVTSTALSDPTDAHGEYCKVLGSIHPVSPDAPPINFQLNLPSAWNQKAVQAGGLRFDGVLVTGLELHAMPPGVPSPVKQGYATFGSDSGHSSEPADASFALNDEALENFGGNQLKKTRDVAVELIKRYYGTTPRRTYFHGRSQGGHESLIVLQRWPQDYDGIVAIHPAYNIVALQLANVRLGQALYGTPGGWLNAEKLATLSAAVMKSCDALDGVSDGLISNVQGCRKSFRLSTLRCPGGKDTGNTCLSDAQIQTVRRFDAVTRFGVRMQAGVSHFARWPILEGGETGQRFGFGNTPTPNVPPGNEAAGIFVMGDQFVRFAVLRDPSFNTLHFEPAKHARRIQVVSEMLDANHDDISAFRDRGGKLLLLHGTADMAIPPTNTVDYYERLKKRYGEKRLREFVRFYMVPGYGHNDGPFVATWNSLQVLDDWVEKNQAPSDLITTDVAPTTSGRTRPLCEYPAWPRYRGTGDVNSASSFECVRK